MIEVKQKQIEEYVIPDKRLGRHVEHDPRSRNFAFVSLVTPEFRRVKHRTYGGILNQGDLGSCTGNAMAAAINSAGLHVKGHSSLKEPHALTIYSTATTLDPFDGQYPPDDTGSSGLAAAKAAKQLGYITMYRHAFSMTEALTALMVGPVITGVDWHEGFDTPDTSGRVKLEGQVRGGHEFVIVGFEPRASLEDSLVLARNSWGTEWGHQGRFNFTVKDWQALLDADGDATVLIP